jgi:hypothetical protein
MERKSVNNKTRQEILHFLLQNHKKGRLKPGATAKAIERFGGCKRTIQNIWKRAMDMYHAGKHMIVNSKKKGRCG